MKLSKILSSIVIILLLCTIFIYFDLFKYLSTNYQVFLKDYIYTLISSIIGLVISIVISLLIFYISTDKINIRKSSISILIIFQTIPIIVIAPLIITFFGFGVVPKIIVVSLLGIYPILNNLDKAFESINSEYDVLFNLIKASKYTKFTKLIFPSVYNPFVSGVKITTSYIFATMILTEYIGGKNGIGIYLSRAVSNFDKQGILLVTIFSVLTTLILVKVSEVILNYLKYKKYGGL